MTKKYTITAALPYANGPLHLGHVAGVYLPADTFVRFLRMNDADVLFVCGSDEHGAAITLRAKKEGVSPKEIVDKYHGIIGKAFTDFGIEFDIYDRTSSALHHETSSDFFKELNNKDRFIQKTSEQYYDADYNQFLADRYITGTCPKCQSADAYGDQCEKCGSDLSPTDLINPKSTLSGQLPVLRKTSHWFLPMDQHEGWLKRWITDGLLDGEQQHDPKAWRNQVTGQCMSWIDGGLKPRAMTRDLDWGVKVPLPEGEGKVLYVWLDAPIGYISATKKWAKENNKKWEDYWLKEHAGDRKLVHFIGKDNIVFHAIIFPILLKDHGGYILPDNVPASEFLNLEGDKFSTSRNWAVWLHEYIEAYPDKIDELKYVLTSIAPESKDAEFTWKDFQSRVNSELADVMGNFLNRTIVLTHKYYNGVIPAGHKRDERDEPAILEMRQIGERIEALMYKYKFREAQSEMMGLARLGNRYLAENEPWKLAKTDPARVETIMSVALEITLRLSIAAYPFLPATSKKIQSILNIEALKWADYENTKLIPGNVIQKPEILFVKIEDDFVENEIGKLQSKASKPSKFKPMKEPIDFDTFQKLDLRMGKIISAEKIEKADKLLKLTVDTGIDVRTVVSGIALDYAPEEIVNKTVLVLLNLVPRKIRGVESQGMVLMAEDEDGKLSFLATEKEFLHGQSVS
jgi:methionyl-tRNA synthetase|tara:strand:- start:16778 stop:18838 length:2061 start_codon:yes stop_codon:yes gene_type:complete